jgi:hypothetical protein
MESEIRVFPGPGGEIQRVHVARPESWQALNFLRPQPAEEALDCFYRIYRQFLVPAAPWVFGNLVMFRLPRELYPPVPYEDPGFGTVADPLTAAALILRRGVWVTGEKTCFRSEAARTLWEGLKSKNCIRIARGKLPVTTIIPVADTAGFLTREAGKLRVNSNFFIMDPFDCATPYDHVGVPFGLLVKDGRVESPPLLPREALLVKKDGTVTVAEPEIRQLRIRIGDSVFVHGKNAEIFTRPERAWTPAGRTALVIVGCRVVAVRRGITAIPTSGFVLCPEELRGIRPGDPVVYEGMENVDFGIQVGNSILRGGVRTECFISRFFNIKGLRRIAFPPSLYPLDFQNARAARIALGADGEGRPMVL